MTIKKILIGIDESKQSEHAAGFAFDIARKFNARVGLVNILSPAVMTQMSATDPIMVLPSQDVGIEEMEMFDIQKNLSDSIFEQTIQKFGKDTEVTHFTEFGSTAEGIISCSIEFKADLIVIGTHNRTGLDRLFSGSIAEHVVRLSHLPVLVVPLNSIVDGQ